MESAEKKLFDGEELDLKVALSIIWGKKFHIILISSIFAIFSVFYALSIPNTYESTAIVAPVDEDVPVSGSLGGLGSLVGINLGSSSNDIDQTIAILNSHIFLSNFINKHQISPILMAVRGWDINEDALVYDSKIYDVEKKTWVANFGAQKKSSPSIQEQVKTFREIYSVAKDRTSGLINISIKSFSPNISKKWVDWIVEDINSYMKDEKIKSANNVLNYLNREILKTNISEVRNVLADLIKKETQTIALSKKSSEYVFKTIDPAIAPEIKSGPFRSIICIVITVFGFVVSLIYVFLTHFLRRI
tara:strand:+ start:11023 stop:11934 length:912 start_codon:yes stop_codon:yes gene_type:complete